MRDKPFGQSFAKNDETGSGQGLAPFWGRSSLGYVMKAELEGGFFHSDVQTANFVTFDSFKW